MKVIVTVEKNKDCTEVNAGLDFGGDNAEAPSADDLATARAMGHFLCKAALCWLETQQMTPAQRRAHIDAITTPSVLH